MGVQGIDPSRWRAHAIEARVIRPLLLGLVSFLTLACGPLSYCFAAGDEALLSVLDQIETLHRANTQRIATWKGTAEVEASTSKPGLTKDTSSAVQFAY